MLKDKSSREKIKNLYNDFILIQDLYQEKSELIKNKDTFKFAKENRVSEIDFVLHTRNQCLLLLKYLYMYGTILLNSICKALESEILKNNINAIPQMSYIKFIKKYDKEIKIHEHLKQELYCFSVYRNKLIGHNDRDRSSGVLIDKLDSSKIKLMAIGMDFYKGSCPNFDKLKIVGQKYFYKGGGGINEIASWLFYRVSWREIEDRKTIENFIENMGSCESYNFLQIKELFSKLIKELKIY